MKKLILTITTLALIGSSNLYAKEIPTTTRIASLSQSKMAKIEIIDAKIKKYNDYLTNLPIKIKEMIAELLDYQDKGNEAVSMTKNLLTTLDKCATNELDEMAALACDDVNNKNVSETIKTYQLEVEDMIKMATKKLKDLRVKDKNTPIIKGALKALENARDILKGVK